MKIGENSTPVRFGVLGTGRITRRLTANLQSTSGASVIAVASREKSRAQFAAQTHGVAHAIEGYQELIRRDDVDAVYVALPPSLHHEVCLAAAEAGKGILCEKPLALNANQAKEIDSACQRANVRWLDATGWLHHERTRRFAEIIQTGVLGRVGHVSASVSFFEPFQTDEHRLSRSLGGGCILDLGWYAVGLTLWVRQCLGEAAESPSIAIGAQTVRRDEVPLRLSASLQFNDGITATLSCGYDTATRKWFEVAGSDQSLICDDFTRPWQNRPARFWLHDRTGSVESESFEDEQEIRMIETLIGDSDLRPLNQLAIQTHEVLDQIENQLHE
ncbi:MAG: Gfo/Idh/MocA family oxidoreductase [Planctomycetota bacterium]